MNRIINNFKHICTPERIFSLPVLQSVLKLAVELVREGREGRKIGTTFTVGDEENVLIYSRALILDPLQGHKDDQKKIDNPGMQETVKELAQIDGAFMLSNSCIVLSAAHYLDALFYGIVLPLGLGARHLAAAAISKYLRTVAVVVLTNSIIPVFDDGKIAGKVLPDLWTIGHESIFIPHPHFEESRKTNITVVTKKRKNKKDQKIKDL